MLEDYTTYTKRDLNGRFTVTTNKIVFTDLTGNENAWVYLDKGVDYFDGAFKHNLEIQIDSSSYIVLTTSVWAMTNAIGTFDYLFANNGHGMFLNVGKTPTTYIRFMLHAVHGGGEDTINYQFDGYLNQVIYLTIERIMTPGYDFYGTLYVSIYSDSARLNLIHTMSVPLYAEMDVKYRYIFGIDNRNYTNENTTIMSGFVQNLDLAPTPSYSASGNFLNLFK